MEKESIIVNLIICRRDGNKEEYDLDIPTFITANELVFALNHAYKLGIDTENVRTCYLRAEYPTALLRGSKTLKEFGLMDGTKIMYVEGENE